MRFYTHHKTVNATNFTLRTIKRYSLNSAVTHEEERTMTVMPTLSLARTAITAAALVLILLYTPACAAAVKGDCMDAAFATAYDAIRARMSTCEAASGTKMDLPLKKKLRVVFCTKCPEMYALATSETLPKCNVTTSNGDEIKLQKLFTKLFSECAGTSSDSESDSNSGSTSAKDSGSGATKTPVITTKTPSTKTPKTTQPSTGSEAAANSVAKAASDNSTSTQTVATGQGKLCITFLRSTGMSTP